MATKNSETAVAAKTASIQTEKMKALDLAMQQIEKQIGRAHV